MDAVDYLKKIMKTRKHKPKDLIEVLGSRTRVSDILNRRRHLSPDKIRRIVAYGVPAHIAIRDYPLVPAPKRKPHD